VGIVADLLESVSGIDVELHSDCDDVAEGFMVVIGDIANSLVKMERQANG